MLATGMQNGEVRRNSIEYDETHRKIKQLDYELNSGAFAVLALLVGKRLFVTNLGKLFQAKKFFVAK